MKQRDVRLLIGILVIIAFCAWIVLPSTNRIHIGFGSTTLFNRDIKVAQGLDLRGGIQLLLEADPSAGQQVTADSMAAVRSIIENRVNGLGVTEPVVQNVGQNRILVELPDVHDPDAAVASLKSTGRLEFVETGPTFLPAGTVIKTTGSQGSAQTSAATPTAAAASTPTANAATPAATAGAGTPAPTTSAATPTAAAPETVYKTILTGADLKTAGVSADSTNKPVVTFELNDAGAKVFADYTTNNINRYLAIVMDGTVISCPRIEGAITEGKGEIQGQFTVAEAQGLAVQLKYGSLPVALKVVERRTVGPSLGQDSVTRSVRAGLIGLCIVLLFMLIYYRLPGLLADFALVTYALVTFALFKIIPVTMTLPGITGFLLSVGMAVDANILIFERMKEELRHGKSLSAAIEAGFSRAWTSIRDSNLSTLITCGILYWFGSTYGASTVRGFAVTLFLGVVVSMFTAIIVTRTFMRGLFALAGDALRDKHWLLGVK